MSWKKVTYVLPAFLLSACTVTQHTPGAFNDVCVGIPIVAVNCVLIWLGISAFFGLVLNNFSANLWALLFKLDDDWDMNVRLWKSAARFGGILAIGALVCYFVFMYPDSQAIASGASACGSVINQ